MSYNWQILRAAVEQEILFPSPKAFRAYIDGMERKGMPFQVMKAMVNDDGTMTVIMRKRYNPTNAFLWLDKPYIVGQPAGDRYTSEEVR